MRGFFLFLLLGQGLIGTVPAATLIPGTELVFNGVSFDYTRVRFDSATGETGADASLSGDTMVVSFGGFGGSALPSPFSRDYGTAYVGLRIQAIDSFIADLTILAQGTYAVEAASGGSWASITAKIPFSMQVLGVNGVPYTSPDLSRSFSLSLDPRSIRIQNPNGPVNQSGQPIPASGTWSAQWSIAGIASTLSEIFQLGANQNITELDVAITPDIATAAGGGGTGTVTVQQIQFTPTPEPSSLTLVGLAGWALLASRRRRRSG